MIKSNGALSISTKNTFASGERQQTKQVKFCTLYSRFRDSLLSLDSIIVPACVYDFAFQLNQPIFMNLFYDYSVSPVTHVIHHHPPLQNIHLFSQKSAYLHYIFLSEATAATLHFGSIKSNQNLPSQHLFQLLHIHPAYKSCQSQCFLRGYRKSHIHI